MILRAKSLNTYSNRSIAFFPAIQEPYMDILNEPYFRGWFDQIGWNEFIFQPLSNYGRLLLNTVRFGICWLSAHITDQVLHAHYSLTLSFHSLSISVRMYAFKKRIPCEPSSPSLHISSHMHEHFIISCRTFVTVKPHLSREQHQLL